MSANFMVRIARRLLEKCLRRKGLVSRLSVVLVLKLDSLAMHHRVVATVAVAWSKQALVGSDRIL